MLICVCGEATGVPGEGEKASLDSAPRPPLPAQLATAKAASSDASALATRVRRLALVAFAVAGARQLGSEIGGYYPLDWLAAPTSHPS